MFFIITKCSQTHALPLAKPQTSFATTQDASFFLYLYVLSLKQDPDKTLFKFLAAFGLQVPHLYVT